MCFWNSIILLDFGVLFYYIIHFLFYFISLRKKNLVYEFWLFSLFCWLVGLQCTVLLQLVKSDILWVLRLLNSEFHNWEFFFPGESRGFVAHWIHVVKSGGPIHVQTITDNIDVAFQRLNCMLNVRTFLVHSLTHVLQFVRRLFFLTQTLI